MTDLGIAASAFVVAFAACATAVLVGIVRRWAERRLLDVPNERSSHDRPTPRGGGLGIVVTIALGLALAAFAWPDGPWAAVTLGGLIVAAIGFADDLRPLPALVRLAAHLGIIAAALSIVGAWTTLDLPLVGRVALGPAGFAVSIVWVVGLMNAFNFMDGIDGIAGMQAVVAGAGWAVLGWLGAGSDLHAIGLLVTGAAVGFLWHNWPPARIFMGDVGSVFLGFLLAMLPLVAAGRGETWGPAGVILLWPFVFDASLTFLRRLARAENILRPHRSHLYQRLSIAGRSHSQVTLLYGALAASGVLVAFLYALRVPGSDLLVVVGLPGLCLLLWMAVVRTERQRTQEMLRVRQHDQIGA